MGDLHSGWYVYWSDAPEEGGRWINAATKKEAIRLANDEISAGEEDGFDCARRMTRAEWLTLPEAP